MRVTTKIEGKRPDSRGTAPNDEPDKAVRRLLTRRAPTERRFGVVGLFAGIGGLELGLSRAGHEAIMLCEIDPPARRVLDTRLCGLGSETKLLEDVTRLRGLPRTCEVLAAGFPCQDLSQVGTTRGLRGKNSGLVMSVLDLLKKRRVEWVLLENVPFMLKLQKGLALDLVLTELESLGYGWAYRIVDSRAFGLPQRRQRVLILASRNEDPRRVLLADDVREDRARKGRGKRANGFYWTEGNRGLGWAEDSVPTLKGGSGWGIPSPPAIWMPDGRIVKPDIRDAERLQGFEPDWTLPALNGGRAGDRWRLVGNAVTVDVAHWVGCRLGQPGRYLARLDAPLQDGAPWPDAAWNVGEGRNSSKASAWPVSFPRLPLARFLEHEPEDLSLRATTGFYHRFVASNLRRPPGFVDALEAHMDRMQEA